MKTRLRLLAIASIVLAIVSIVLFVLLLVTGKMALFLFGASMSCLSLLLAVLYFGIKDENIS